MITQNKSIAEWEVEIGAQCRALRLSRNLDQESEADGAGLSLSALKRLESGKGATLKTLIKVLRYLDRTDWLVALSPPVSISPLQMAKHKPRRQRASSPRRTLTDAK
jgi:transcriptional regulator with XRE-family HTH domain